MQFKEELNKIKTCCHLLPPPGGEVVLELLAVIAEKDKEIERLNKELIDISIQFQYQMEGLNKEIARLKENIKGILNCKPQMEGK